MITENGNNKLGQEVTIKENMLESKKVLPVLYYEDFYKIIHKVHLDFGHSGVNKTDYAIGIRFVLVPRSVIAEYCRLFAICNRTVKQLLQSTISVRKYSVRFLTPYELHQLQDILLMQQSFKLVASVRLDAKQILATC